MRRRRRLFLIESLAVLCVLGRPVHVPSARNREKRLSVCWFQICTNMKRHNSIQHTERACAILKHHNSIHHAHRVPFPSAFRSVCIFAPIIFSFLNLSYVKGWSGKYSLFLELLRYLMSKRHTLSYCCCHKSGAWRPNVTHYNLRLLLIYFIVVFYQS